MTPHDYVSRLRDDGEALARAATGALDRAVASCPGWTVADLVAHTGQVHRDKAQIVRRGGTEWFARTQVPVPEAGRLLDWYREGLADLADLLARSDADQPAWSWAGDQPAHATLKAARASGPGAKTVAFWQRRMAHETAVHRWDAEIAVGAPSPIGPPELAADGVAEVLEVHAPSQLDDGPYDGPAGTVHVHTTDTPGEWLVDLAPPALGVTRTHAKADVALRGTASDLDLVLWRRLPPERAELFGDAALLSGFLDWIDHS